MPQFSRWSRCLLCTSFKNRKITSRAVVFSRAPFPNNRAQNWWNNVEKSSKTGKNKKLWYLLLYNFWRLVLFFFLERNLGTRLCFHPCLSFSIIFDFSKIEVLCCLVTLSQLSQISCTTLLVVNWMRSSNNLKNKIPSDTYWRFLQTHIEEFS